MTTSDESIEKGARRLASWFGCSYDGLQKDRIQGFPQWAFDGAGHKFYQGGQQDLKDLVVKIAADAEIARNDK